MKGNGEWQMADGLADNLLLACPFVFPLSFSRPLFPPPLSVFFVFFVAKSLQKSNIHGLNRADSVKSPNSAEFGYGRSGGAYGDEMLILLVSS